LDVKKETSTFVFHTSKLDIGAASLYSDALGEEQADQTRAMDQNLERATLHFAKAIPADSKAQLRVAFSSKLSSSMMGYYRSSWEHEGERKNYSMTQFEVRLDA